MGQCFFVRRRGIVGEYDVQVVRKDAQGPDVRPQTIDPRESAQSQGGQFMIPLRAWARLATLVLIALLAGEIGARLDDRLFVGTPVAASPTFDGLFFTLDDGIRRGVPHARFKNFQLNSLGLLGPEMSLERKPDCERWLFLGASETFGEASVKGSDYPSKLRDSFAESSCVEIANAASPGLDLRAVTNQYAGYLFHLRPDVVFVYPPTQFYLGDLRERRDPPRSDETKPPGMAPPRGGADGEFSISRLLESSRLVERLRDTAEMPASIQRMRTKRWIQEALDEHRADWPYSSMPEDRLTAFDEDLEILVRRIRETGARPVVLVHAVRVANPPREEDRDDLLGVRRFTPRATPEIFTAFEYAAAARTRSIARRLGVSCVDLAAHISGSRDLFIDVVHFTPDGASLVSRLIMDVMSSESAGDGCDALQ